MAGKRKPIDWETLERDWRAGIKSVLQIAADYETETGQKVSHTAINKHFKKLGVPRDLSAKVRAKADAIVSAAMVSGKVSTETTVADSEIIAAGAVKVANVKIAHRGDLERGRNIVNSMLAELEQECGPENAALLSQLGDIMRSEDENGQDKRNDLYQKIISLPGRAKTLKDLADSLSKLIDKERQAFGLADKADEAPPPAQSMLISDEERAALKAITLSLRGG